MVPMTFDGSITTYSTNYVLQCYTWASVHQYIYSVMMNINAYCIYEIHVMQILFALCSNTNLVLSSYLIQKHTWAFDGHTGSGFIHCRISQTWKTAILRGGVGTRPFVYEGLNSFVACPTTSRPYSLCGVRGPTTINCVRDG